MQRLTTGEGATLDSSSLLSSTRVLDKSSPTKCKSSALADEENSRRSHAAHASSGTKATNCIFRLFAKPLQLLHSSASEQSSLQRLGALKSANRSELAVHEANCSAFLDNRK